MKKEDFKYKEWFQLEQSHGQKNYGFVANQIFRIDNSAWWMSYQPYAPDTQVDETALMPAEIILKGDHRNKLTEIYKEKGKEGCEEYFHNSEDKITEGFMKITTFDIISREAYVLKESALINIKVVLNDYFKATVRLQEDNYTVCSELNELLMKLSSPLEVINSL